MDTKTCSVCNEDKSLSEFYARSSRCKTCHKLYTKEHYKNNKDAYVTRNSIRNRKVEAENRKFLLQYLCKNPCVDCGNPDIEVLQFDHRDSTLKTGAVSDLLTHSRKRLEEEVAKCDIRCANCHTKRTRRQRNQWRVGSFSKDFVWGKTVMVPQEYLDRLNSWVFTYDMIAHIDYDSIK